MTKTAAFGALGWLAGLASGVGASLENWSTMAVALVLTLFFLFYYHRFIKPTEKE